MPAAVPRGVGRPSGGSGKGPGVFRTDFLEGLPNSFPNIAPGRPPGSQLLRAPFTQPGGTARPRQPGGDSNGVTPVETRVGPIPIALRFPLGSKQADFLGVNVWIWSLLPRCHLRSLPRGWHRPGAAMKAEDFFSYPNPKLGIPTPKRPGREAFVGRTSLCPALWGGNTQFLGEAPPLSLRIPVLE